MKLGGKFSLSDYGAMQTAQLLEIDGEYIRLKRDPEWVDDGAGGVIKPLDAEGPRLAKQKFWFFEAAPIAHIARGTNFQQTIGMGQRTTTNFVIVGMPDANVRQGDTFEREGYEYKVIAVHPDRREQTIAELERITDPQGDEYMEEDDDG